MGNNCLTAVCAQLQVTVQRITAWTDSLTVWHWLQCPAHHWKTWLANRVAAIKEISNKHNIEWKHWPGVENPADMASRGTSVNKLKKQLLVHRFSMDNIRKRRAASSAGQHREGACRTHSMRTKRKSSYCTCNYSAECMMGAAVWKATDCRSSKVAVCVEVVQGRIQQGVSRTSGTLPTESDPRSMLSGS